VRFFAPARTPPLLSGCITITLLSLCICISVRLLQRLRANHVQPCCVQLERRLEQPHPYHHHLHRSRRTRRWYLRQPKTASDVALPKLLGRARRRFDRSVQAAAGSGGATTLATQAPPPSVTCALTPTPVRARARARTTPPHHTASSLPLPTAGLFLAATSPVAVEDSAASNLMYACRPWCRLCVQLQCPVVYPAAATASLSWPGPISHTAQHLCVVWQRLQHHRRPSRPCRR
jgi:hypothetical protein